MASLKRLAASGLLSRYQDCELQSLIAEAIDTAPETFCPEAPMAKITGLDKMSYAELTQVRAQIDQLLVEKQSVARAELRQQISTMAKEHGLSLQELFGKGSKAKGGVAPKYRDPKDPNNTWSGRGRMPNWLTSALKGGKASKDDFLI